MATGYMPVNYRRAKEHNRLDELLSELDILAEKDVVINKPKRVKTDFNADDTTLPWEPPSYLRHPTGLTPPPTFPEEEDPFLSDIQFKDTPTISKVNYKQNISDSFIQFDTPQVHPLGINHSTNIQPHQFQQTTTASVPVTAPLSTAWLTSVTLPPTSTLSQTAVLSSTTTAPSVTTTTVTTSQTTPATSTPATSSGLPKLHDVENYLPADLWLKLCNNHKDIDYLLAIDYLLSHDFDPFPETFNLQLLSLEAISKNKLPELPHLPPLIYLYIDYYRSLKDHYTRIVNSHCK